MLDDVPSEFPRINENLLGRPTRFGYAYKMTRSSAPVGQGIIKYDLRDSNSETHTFGRGRYCSEAVFVPRPHSQEEDDGWLLTFVYDSSEDKSELVVVNAQDMTAEPIARVLIPQRVPYGFHGTWVTEEQLQRFSFL